MNHKSVNPLLTKKKKSYVHVDSSYRNKNPVYDYGTLINLPPFPLFFSNASSQISIYLKNHIYEIGDKIMLGNVISKNSILNNALAVKKNSYFMRIQHKNHGLSLFGLYDSSNDNDFSKIDYIGPLPLNFKEDDDIPDIDKNYYVAKINSQINLKIKLSHVQGTDKEKNLIGNISVNLLNSIHKIFLIFTKNNDVYDHDPDYYLIYLGMKSNVNYNENDLINGNNVHIKYCNLYGVSLENLNANKNMRIVSVTKDTFTIDIGYPAIVDPIHSFYHNSEVYDDKIILSNRGGGKQIYVRKITNIMDGYPDPSQYLYKLDQSYKNVTKVKITASIFPNSQDIVKDSKTPNNKLYWRNLDDGIYTYELSLDKGNYTTRELERKLKNKFNKTIRYRYTKEHQVGIVPKYVNSKNVTPLDNNMYDENGVRKHHNFQVKISEINHRVAISSYGELLQTNSPANVVLSIPDAHIEFTMAGDLRTNFGVNGTGIVKDMVRPFNPSQETLFIYFTENSHMRIKKKYPNTYHNLYIYVDHLLNNKFVARLDTDTCVLVNFIRKNVFPHESKIMEFNSINTNTKLVDFNYDEFSNNVTLYNHSLKKGDIIITDQFINSDKSVIYKVVDVVDKNNFVVTKSDNYKFIYDGVIINFNENDADYWLDQILPNDVVNNNTLSFVKIKPKPENKKIMKIKHLNHQLKAGDKIKIHGSRSLNSVPENKINVCHIITKVLNENSYQVTLKNYNPVYHEQNNIDTIKIKYPTKFQLLFTNSDTLGELLGFDNVGRNDATTFYKHKIKNTDPNLYESGISNKNTKLNMTGHNYFYLCSDPQLTIFDNTKVENVFSIIRWFDNPGNVVFDSFVPSKKKFEVPVNLHQELLFSMRDPNGNLMEFNGLDHSFTIEITQMITNNQNFLT